MGIEPKAEIIIVTGLSGAGRSTCLKLLEDYNFEAIDNLPLTLMSNLFSTLISNPETEPQKKIAVGVDPRTRGFSAQSLIDTLEKLKLQKAKFYVVFLDCDNASLIRRFTETRRKHPLAIDRPVSDGIKTERKLLEGVRQAADFIIDSSNLTLPQFQTLVKNTLNLEKSKARAVTVISFGFRNIDQLASLINQSFIKKTNYNDKVKKLKKVGTNILYNTLTEINFVREYYDVVFKSIKSMSLE